MFACYLPACQVSQVCQAVKQHHLTRTPCCVWLFCTCSDSLKGTVRELERLHIEAGRSLSAATNLEAAATPVGPQPTVVECVEALQDMW